MDTAGSIAIGDVLEGKYLIEGELGEGAMGLVFAARHKSLNKRVAIKALRAEIAREADLVGRFEQEARAASAIGHPNIVQVFDLGISPGGVRFMVMEHLDGCSLGELLAAEPILAPERAARIVGQVLSALAAAHRRGIVHRDLKPENIFLSRNEESSEFVKLLDFGISKVLEIADPSIAGVDSSARATRLGTVLGTPLYMSPEQARGDVDIDHRVDIWAVGCVLYEMLCGQTPYHGENYNQILLSILSGTYPAPREVRPAITPALEAVIARAMAQGRDQRFASAADMRAALDAALGGQSTVPGLGGTSAERAEAEALELDDVVGAPSTATALADSATGLAAAAAGGKQDEAALLDALSRIAGDPDAGAMADDQLLTAVATEEPPPAAAPAVRTPAPAAASAAGDAASGDRFAPPEAASEDLALVLEGPSVERVPEPSLPPRAAPKRRTTGAEIRARAPGSRLGAALKGLFVLALLGAGGFAGYRYAVYGYVLAPPKPTSVVFELGVSPANAAIAVNGEPAPPGAFKAEIGKEYTIQFSAKGHMSARRHLLAEADKPAKLDPSLPHLLRPISARGLSELSGGAEKAREEVPAAALESAIDKLSEFSSCLESLAEPIEEGRSKYLATTGRSRKIDRRHIPTILPLPEETVTACRMVLRGAADIDPPMPRLDEMAGAHMRVVDELVELTQRLEKYYKEREYEVDKFGLGKRLHAPLVKSYASAAEQQGELIAAVSAQRHQLDNFELAAIAEREGEGLHWQLRRLALASHAWLWSELTKAPRSQRGERREALIQLYQEVAATVGDGGKGLSSIDGARAYYDVAREMVELARAAESDGLALDAAIERHNRSIELFNSMLL